jgi:hypothetical protein
MKERRDEMKAHLIVSIGDVGSVTAEGIFDFFFNIFLPPEHLINGNRTPEVVMSRFGSVQVRRLSL